MAQTAHFSDGFNWWLEHRTRMVPVDDKKKKKKGTYPVFFVVANDNGRVPLGGSFSTVHLGPVTNDNRWRCHQNPLTRLELGPLSDRLLHLPTADPLFLVLHSLVLLLQLVPSLLFQLVADAPKWLPILVRKIKRIINQVTRIYPFIFIICLFIYLLFLKN